ncbi:aldehyde dehydrogenase family protein, partial [Arthrobacter sp. H41]|uniref:aldehyde dehydrogenase family protein n=1 Tax=Arthrobacter sp. H41 TaxID=1312978 RepID=UPI00138AE453
AVGEAADLLVDKLAERAKDITVGNGMDASSDMGPVITPASRDRVRRIVTSAEEAGAAVVVDGRDLIVAAAFGSAGERCMAVSVAVAVGEAADLLVDKLAERAKDITVGNGMDASSDMGPVITPASRDRVRRIVTSAEEAGAAVVVDGRDLIVADHENGFFVGPTVLDHVRQGMEAYEEEIFGPVLVVLRVDSLDEGIEVINANPYGNGTAIFTSSGAYARQFKRRVTVGMIGINVPIPVPVAWHSFGGWKDSLFGDHHVYGPDGVRFYTRGKAVT